MKAIELLRIGRLFDERKWALADPDGPFPQLFERFARMYALLAAPERDILLTISKRYSWFRSQQYAQMLLQAWRQLVPLLRPTAKTIVLAPLIAKGDKHPKSGDVVVKVAEEIQANLERSVAPNKLFVFKSAAQFGPKFGNDPDAVLVLVDDYLGSGNSATRALLPLLKKYPQARVTVLALVAQAEALAKVAELCMAVRAGVVLDRAVSDEPSFAGATGPALDAMKRLGKRLGFKDDESLGYHNTEGIVTMMRTPNDTLPMYWTNRKVKGEVWPSPFTRRTNRV